jgi:hypothetical protein
VEGRGDVSVQVGTVTTMKTALCQAFPRCKQLFGFRVHDLTRFYLIPCNNKVCH